MHIETLEEQIVRRVREWIPRAAEHTRSTLDGSKLVIIISNPGADDDGHTLHLDAIIRETNETYIGGPIPGMDLDEPKEETESNG